MGGASIATAQDEPAPNVAPRGDGLSVGTPLAEPIPHSLSLRRVEKNGSRVPPHLRLETTSPTGRPLFDSCDILSRRIHDLAPPSMFLNDHFSWNKG